MFVPNLLDACALDLFGHHLLPPADLGVQEVFVGGVDLFGGVHGLQGLCRVKVGCVACGLWLSLFEPWVSMSLCEAVVVADITQVMKQIVGKQ